MQSAGFEPANPATKRLQIYALERTATGIDRYNHIPSMAQQPLVTGPPHYRGFTITLS
jgi:hypothetical protein